MAMEARLSAKMEKVAAAAEEALRISHLTVGNLGKLEAKVNENEEALRTAI